MNIPLTICIAFFSFFFIGCKHNKKNNNIPEKPNIIIILADDLGYGGIGCYGHKKIVTPNLDSLSAQGIRFTDFHSNGAVCTPTRAALMTGRYQQKTGLEGVIYVGGETRKTGLDSSEVTIADVMKQAGYKTGIVGKWHLGYAEQYNPVYNGFEEFYGYRSGNVDYHSHYDNAGVYDWYHNLDTISEEGYVTDLITEHAIDFIRNNKENPFFLYIAHEAPHVPFQGRNDPAYRFPHEDFSYKGPVKDRARAYKEMVEVMDEGIGYVINTLEKLQLTEHTLVFFFSDNGGIKKYGDNGILRGYKSSLYEGGHRVPAIAYWKNKIKPGISDATLMSFDLFPTILSICNIDKNNNMQCDGIDFSPVLIGENKTKHRDLFWRYREQKAVRSGNMKLLIIKQDTMLFDLSADIEEQNNISLELPHKRDEMLKKLTTWENEIDKYHLKTD